VEGGKAVGRSFTAAKVSTVSTCDRAVLGEARAPGPDIGKGFVDPVARGETATIELDLAPTSLHGATL
jgi:hypothetical protein